MYNTSPMIPTNGGDDGQGEVMGGDGRILEARRAVGSDPYAGSQQDLSAKGRWRTQAERCAGGIRGNRVCDQDGVSMESAAVRAVWERQRHTQALYGLGEGWLVRGLVEKRAGGIRRSGRNSLALAEHRWGDDESPDGTGIRGGKPNGSGKKMEASDTCW